MLIWADKRFDLTRGRLFALYVAAYTLGRTGIEALRVDHANHILGLRLNVWTSIKSNLRNCPQLERFVNRHSNVEHITSRGGAFIRGRGPVLMAWADMDDIGEIVRYSGDRIRALCVITWNEDAIRPWVSAAQPAVLGDSSAWENLTLELDPVVVEAMKSLTLTINHNNTISAGFE